MTRLFLLTESAFYFVSQDILSELKRGVDKSGNQLKDIENKGLNHIKKSFGS